ncbi:O-methyltransferase [Talaromyces proteolyticus]|uniref:O-methyltransferase n=1 Tax=Talaromyces proteolyticus TaxID=1131652 RepID=A0AAD4PUS5_9EURO|nr:O-methyltransferase [Talaromyces proteolyticus]KAH8690489.1 O-methyltransferase [Talaromyces proteolyticus]
MTSSLQYSPVQAPSHILGLLERLHALSLDEEPLVNNALKDAVQLRNHDVDAGNRQLDNAMRDKFVALDKDKCHFVYQLILATGAKNVVEAGTSFGVSTIYLALAVGRNSSGGKVIATEKEPEKARQAKEHWKEAGETVLKHIELREGDLLQTLHNDLPEIDLLLLDIWTPLALPTLKVVQPRLRPGAVIVADNTISSAVGYKEFFDYVKDPEGPFRTLTLPYSGGLELVTYMP